ncbi:MAG: metal-dependent hydrolase [Thermosipho sp. (in: Bacteria)]|nr:metal-dependent hydrolase [Thermosipho sp. (in: thermotogales)]
MSMCIVFIVFKIFSIDSGLFVIVSIGAITGSLLPDCDNEHAPMGSIIPLWLVLKHRTFTHSVFFILLSLLVCLINFYFGFGLFVGVVVHILSDMLTVMGCPLLYPISKRYISISRFKTGSSGEDFIRIFAFLLIIYEIFIS